jgi:signal transduction histidine kinase
MVAAHAVNLALLQREFGSVLPELKDRISKLQQEAHEIAESIRDFSHELHPSIVDHLGLPGAVRIMCRHQATLHQLQAELSIMDPLPPLSIQIQYTLYRIAQEIVTNITKHARAKRFELRLSASEDVVRLQVDDDGVGFDRTIVSESTSFGLLSIDERVHHFKGSLVIESVPLSGTRLIVTLPTITGSAD